MLFSVIAANTCRISSSSPSVLQFNSGQRPGREWQNSDNGLKQMITHHPRNCLIKAAEQTYALCHPWPAILDIYNHKAKYPAIHNQQAPLLKL
jgi:hypothetical protein